VITKYTIEPVQAEMKKSAEFLIYVAEDFLQHLTPSLLVQINCLLCVPAHASGAAGELV
jgi:hypothetical protein